MSNIERRKFIALLGGAASAASAWPQAPRAQQGERMRRVGVLVAGTATDPEFQARTGAFRDGLAKLGWAEGRNIQLDLHFTSGISEHMVAEAAALIGLPPEVILVSGSGTLEAVLKHTRSIPVVFASASDPVSAGYVSSLARPGGNVTGFSNFEYAIAGKWLEVLKEAAPRTNRIGILLLRDDPSWSRYLAEIDAVAPTLGTELTRIFLSDDPAETERNIAAFAQEAHGGLVVTPNNQATIQRDLIIGLAARHRLPAIYPIRVYATSGGLMTYGVDPTDQWRRSASYVDRILRGEKPGDLPVQLPTKFEFVVNLKTARALGITLPLPLIGRTDEVIE